MESGSRGGNAATSPAAAAAFVLGSPPLAALHSMTEMKSAMLQHYTPTSMAAAQCLKNASLHGIPPNVSSKVRETCFVFILCFQFYSSYQ